MTDARLRKSSQRMLVWMFIVLCFFGAVSASCFDDEDGETASPTPTPTPSWSDPGGDLNPDEVPSRAQAYPAPNVASMNSDRLWDDFVDTEVAHRRVLVALKDPSDVRGFYDGRVMIDSNDYDLAKKTLLENVAGVEELEDRPITLANGARLPIFEARIASQSALHELRASSYVDFVEPSLLPADHQDSLACGGSPYVQSDDPRASDKRLPGPDPGADLVPYLFSFHHVKEAWDRLGPEVSNRPLPGEDQTIAVVDTGVSEQQEQFFSRFALYYPRPSVVRINTTYPQPMNDVCSHGTKVASVAAAPRDGRSIVGIAWNAPLVAIKATTSPVVAFPPAPPPGVPEEPSVAYLCDGITSAVDGWAVPPTKVVAMALGLGYESPTIKECLSRAIARTELDGTLFVAAAGTRVPRVVFPATLPDVLAVSMLRLDTNGVGYELIDTGFSVAYGPEVDFVSVYDEASQLPTAGIVGNAEEDEIAKLGFSSAATSIYAGLLSLASAYAEEQGWDRAQLIAALKLASTRAGIEGFDDATLEQRVGAGILDVYRATGGARNAAISAPLEVEPGTQVTLVGSTDAVVPPGASPPAHFEYEWEVGGESVGSGSSISVEAPDSGTMNINLTVEDKIDGKRLSASHSIQIVSDAPPLERRTLYWNSHVTDFATFFNGGRHDYIVNADVSMPEGCMVEAILGLPLERADGTVRPIPGVAASESWTGNGAGFTVSRPPGTPSSNLRAFVHQWHDGISAVRTKVVYEILEPASTDCLVPNTLTTSP